MAGGDAALTSGASGGFLADTAVFSMFPAAQLAVAGGSGRRYIARDATRT
jgi:hypothetical protein